MSRTIVNSSDGLNSWDIEQSTSTATNTGTVERVITGVNVSVAFIQDTRTNLLAYSEDFSNAYWNKSGSSVSSGFTSPDGTTNTFKLVEGTNTGAHNIKPSNIEFLQNINYTLSFYVKAGERNEIILREGARQGLEYATINLLNGIVTLTGTVTTANWNLVDVSTKKVGDYYRVSVTANTTLTITSTFFMDIRLSNGTSASYTGDGTSGVYIYGAQLESQSHPTSYIPTSGTAVTVDSNSTSVVNNTGIVERPITGVSDGLNSWDIEQSTGTTNSTTTIRYINPPTIIPNLLSLLQARATYYENVTCTTAILTELETIEI
jgi:hypothetical protein